VPSSYYAALHDAKYLRDDLGDHEAELNEAGRQAMKRLGYRDVGFGLWEPPHYTEGE
jgi:hypothetical protein